MSRENLPKSFGKRYYNGINLIGIDQHPQKDFLQPLSLEG
jgi:hypothetical protein